MSKDKKRVPFLEREPFRFGWTYPVNEPKTIAHKARKCAAVVRDQVGYKERDERRKVVLRMVKVPAYTQVVR